RSSADEEAIEQGRWSAKWPSYWGEEEALLPITQLRDVAREGDILQGLVHNSLVAAPKLAANGYTTIFNPDGKGVEVYDKQDVVIEAKNAPKLRGWQDESGLWRVPMVDGLADDCWTEGQKVEHVLPKEQVNNLFNLPSTEQRVDYIHACLGFPTKAAMLSATRAGRLLTIPFATVANINEFYPETNEMPKGHLDQQRQGVRSTRETNEDNIKAMELSGAKKEHDVYVKVWDLRETTYSDQTGVFRFRSYRGHRYRQQFHLSGANEIEKKQQKWWTRTTAYLTGSRRQALIPRSMSLTTSSQTRSSKPSRRSASWGWCHLDATEETLLRLWPELLPQAELTLNLLRPSHARPNISALAYFSAPFDFDCAPLAPIGCEVLLHQKPGQRGSWEEHAVNGWYLGCSSKHYRCSNVWVKRTMTRRVSDTVVFKHKYITWPSQTPNDLIVKAAHDLIKALRGKVNHEGQQQIEDLKRLGDVFQDIAQDKQDEDSPSAVREPRVRIPRPSDMCAPAPRVEAARVAPEMEEAPLPRVEEESTPQSREESPTRLIVESEGSPTKLIVESAAPAAPAQATSRPARE
ncbi:hypothetical protein ACHAWF_007069, partial [Thalassiosira exigua]